MSVAGGVALGIKNGLRVSIFVDPKALEEGLERIEAFYKWYFKKKGKVHVVQIVMKGFREVPRRNVVNFDLLLPK